MIPECFQNKTVNFNFETNRISSFFYVQIVSLANDLRRNFFRNLQKEKIFIYKKNVFHFVLACLDKKNVDILLE